MEIRELTSLNEMFAAFSVLKHMYPNLTKDKYQLTVAKRHDNGYRMVGAFDGTRCVAAGGFWIDTRFYCGHFLQLDNLVSLPEFRGKGAGHKIVAWIKALAKKEQCERILIDSYVENYDAHRFFLREGFIIRGYHMNFCIT